MQTPTGLNRPVSSLDEPLTISRSGIRLMIVTGRDVPSLDVDTLASGQLSISALAERGEEVTKIYALNKPDIVLMPQHLHGQIDGVEAARRLKEVFPLAKVVLLIQSHSAESLYHALKAGISALLPIETSLEQMLPVLQQVHTEDICWIEPRLARLLPSLFSTSAQQAKHSKKSSFNINIPSPDPLMPQKADPNESGQTDVGLNPTGLNAAYVGVTSAALSSSGKRFASAPASPLSAMSSLSSLSMEEVSLDLASGSAMMSSSESVSSSGHSGHRVAVRDNGLPLGLTGREVDVLKLITEGRSNQDIARHLIITQNTVKTHMKNIFHKLGVSDRTGAAVKALRENLLA